MHTMFISIKALSFNKTNKLEAAKHATVSRKLLVAIFSITSCLKFLGLTYQHSLIAL